MPIGNNICELSGPNLSEKRTKNASLVICSLNKYPTKKVKMLTQK